MQWFSRRPYIALLTSMTIVAAIPLIFSIVLYLNASRTISRQVEDLVVSAHMQYQQRMDQVLSDLNRIAIRASANQRITQALKTGDTLNTADRLNISAVRQDLAEYVSCGPESISDIYIYDNTTGHAVTRLAVYDDQLLYKRFYAGSAIDQNRIDAMHQAYSTGELVSLGQNRDRLVYYRSLPTYSRNKIPDLQMVVTLNKSYFERHYEEVRAFTSHFFVLSADGATFLAGDSDLELSAGELTGLQATTSGSLVEVSGAKMRYYATRSKAGAYLVCSLVSQNYLNEQTRNYTRLSSIILAVCFLLAVIAVLLLSRQNYIPINRLQKYIRENYGPGQDEDDEGGIYAIQETVQTLITQKKLSEQQLETVNRAMGIAYLKSLLQGESLSMTDAEPQKKTYVSWTDEYPYAVVCFYIIPSAGSAPSDTEFNDITLNNCKQTIGQAGKSVLQDCCTWEIAAINSLVVLVFGSREKTGDLAWYSGKVEQLITLLDDQYDLSVQAGLSKLHTGTDGLETAYNEAALALEQCFSHEDTILARFDDCEFKAGFLLRDWIHIDKLQQFTLMVTAGRYKESLTYLDELFPETYLETVLPESEISALQLSSMKYQFLHVFDRLHERCPFFSETKNEIKWSACQDINLKFLSGITSFL